MAAMVEEAMALELATDAEQTAEADRGRRTGFLLQSLKGGPGSLALSFGDGRLDS
jgi:hypothetical protein